MDKSKRAALVQQMTLEEKAGLCSGLDFWHTKPIPRLGIPSVMFSDGPHGLRKQAETGDHLGLNDAATAICFPAGGTTACSFDRGLIRRMGKILGNECQAENVSVLLGPAINIKRSPLCGRNFEYYSEDPYVAGELSVAYIHGLQSEQVGASVKHFAANNQEHERMYSSSDVDERTLREIYLAGFEKSVKQESPRTIMCSYNRLNGEYASQNKRLLNDILRDEWGYSNLVMSDWGAVSDRVLGLAAGMDLEMPGSGGVTDRQILDAVQNGSLPEAVLDQAVDRVLNLVFSYTENHHPAVLDHAADHAAAVDIARQCMVLLKNDDHVLPLSSAETVAFIGGFASKPRFQGGGSSHIQAFRVPSAAELGAQYGRVLYSEGFPSDSDKTDESAFSAALETAKKADKIVVFAGLPDAFESEGYDRTHMRLPECQNALIMALTALGKPVVVVLQNGSPVEMPWIHAVPGVLEAYLGGEGVSEALLDLLYGKANPCGKLAETFPEHLEDNPSYLSFPGSRHHVPYNEGIFVGYRYYDKKNMPVLFPFGHGLSYTTFDYHDLKTEGGCVENGGTVHVSVEVTNTGDRPGKEVVQLYVSDRTGCVIRPEQELKGFETITLAPGETGTLQFELDKRAFAWYSTEISDWYAANGSYEIRIGHSSRNIVLTETITLTGASPLPLTIDEDVMLGELLADDRTSAFIKGQLMEYLSAFSGGGSGVDPMLENMVKYMPLRSLRSFLSLKQERLDEIICGLRRLV